MYQHLRSETNVTLVVTVLEKKLDQCLVLEQLINLINWYTGDGVHLGPLGTAATNRFGAITSADLMCA
jgi:hypothetical protein